MSCIKKISLQKGKVEGEEWIVLQTSSQIRTNERKKILKAGFSAFRNNLWAAKYSVVTLNLLLDEFLISSIDADEIYRKHLDLEIEKLDIELPPKMWEAQKKAVKELLVHKKRLLWGEAGSGKTWVALETLYHLWKKKKNLKALIVVPNSNIIAEWLNELSIRDYPQKFQNLFFYNSKLTCNDNAIRISGASTGVFLVTYKYLTQQIQNKVTTVEAVKRFTPDVLIYDESHRLKNKTSSSFKKASKLTAEHVYLLTGTPWDKLISDIWSQAFIVDSSTFGKNYDKYEEKYALRDFAGKKKFAWGVKMFYKILGIRPEMTEQFYSKLFQNMTCIFKEGLPDKVDIVHRFNVGSKAKKVINKLRKGKSYEEYVYTLLDSGLISVDEMEKIKIQGDSFRLNSIVRNLCSGFLRNPELGIDVKLDDNKVKCLQSVVERLLEEEKKMIIFTQSHNEIADIEKALKKEGVRYVVNTGRTTAEERKKNKELFTKNREVMVYLGTTAANREGLNLQVAHHIIYYSLPNEDYIIYSQSMDRIHRGEQKEVCCYHYLFDDLGEEEKVYNSLIDKLDNVADVKEARQEYNKNKEI